MLAALRDRTDSAPVINAVGTVHLTEGQKLRIMCMLMLHVDDVDYPGLKRAVKRCLGGKSAGDRSDQDDPDKRFPWIEFSKLVADPGVVVTAIEELTPLQAARESILTADLDPNYMDGLERANPAQIKSVSAHCPSPRLHLCALPKASLTAPPPQRRHHHNYNLSTPTPPLFVSVSVSVPLLSPLCRLTANTNPVV